MFSSHRCFTWWATALLAITACLRAASEPKSGRFEFSLLPKSLQRNPDLEMTVNTEMTDYGRMLRTPTPGNPMYFLAFSSGYKQMGDTVGGENPPTAPAVEAALKKALAVNGFMPADAQHRPNLVIFYFWGSHNRLTPEMEANFPQLAARHRLERAMLVGGHREVDTMARVMEWGETLNDRTARYEYLRDQALEDLYFVVASAYDYAALAHKERKLVWRTTMTVNAIGVSMRETVGPLIATAAPYFGHDMTEPEIEMRRINRWGVIMGEPKVVNEDVALPRAGTPPATSPNASPATEPPPALRK